MSPRVLLSVQRSDPPDQEARIVAGLRVGDGHAFTRAWEAHHARVFGFLVRLLGRRDLAEDLLQETFVRLARHAPRLASDTRLHPWLLTVARNLASSFLRWQRLDGERLAALPQHAEKAEPPSPFEHAVASEAEVRLERTLAQLPAKYREVLLLVGVDALSPEEAAAVLGIKPEALRQRLHRARAMLDGRLGDQHLNDEEIGA